MDLPVKALTFVVILFTIMFFLFDINKLSVMKSTNFGSQRAANQGTLDDQLSGYQHYQLLDSSEMVEEWITNFVNTHGVEFDSIRLNFGKVSQEPPLFLVSVQGYDDSYALMSGEVFSQYVGGVTIVSEEIS